MRGGQLKRLAAAAEAGGTVNAGEGSALELVQGRAVVQRWSRRQRCGLRWGREEYFFSSLLGRQVAKNDGL